MICYLSRNYKGVNSAGNKAKADVEQLMQAQGFRNVGKRQTRYTHTLPAFFSTLLSVVKGVCCLRRGDLLVLQYPLKKYYTFVCNMAHLRGCKVVTLIHDLGSFRSKRLTIPQEIERLNHSDALIVHSEAMKEWLAQHGIRGKMEVLGLFDYLSESQPATSLTPTQGCPYRLLFVGVLSERHNGFLYKLAAAPHSYEMMLYGGGLETDKLQSPVNDMGFVPSDQLIATSQGDFGIVWYGMELEGGIGPLGEYLQYNAPHKLSLYLRCGLPVIIWDKAGQAPFVRQHDIGICVSSLAEVEGVLAKLTVDRYLEMKKNTLDISQKLSEGFFFSRALAQACKDLDIPNNNEQ
ncbi:MAG: galactofuranosyltransferase [Mediterranea sp.]|jgi:glycosyltransferase involved in cell wall biosynthesis|nr:galactofuranosyltransferase [Mediterranea sp.]